MNLPGCVDGPNWPGVACFTTTRAGGVSRPPYEMNLATHVGDEWADVERNRAILRAVLPAEPCWLDQVHGVQVHDADLGCAAAPPQADAAVTAHAERVLAILTADCLPVVIADTQARALAVAHAGWRGLAAGVLQAAVSAVRARVTREARLQAWIGPALGPQAFEVGADVLQAFAGRVPEAAFVPMAGRPGKWLGNLPLIAAHLLQAAGVAEVVQSGVCTFSDPRLHSYRRDGTCGRLATVAWLRGPRQS